MTQAATALRIPQAMGPTEIGPYLRELREYFNLSREDVSARLHIRVRYVTAIEEGKFEQMPGIVYARGYVHTYAEFLGLDAEQVVLQCFPDAVKETKAASPGFVPKTATAKPRLAGADWRSVAIVAVFGILALVVYTQLTGAPDAVPVTEQRSTVAPVPESMLASVRSVVMPTARSYACLTETDYLACFYGDALVQLLPQLATGAGLPYMPQLNPQDFQQAAPEAETGTEKVAPAGVSSEKVGVEKAVDKAAEKVVGKPPVHNEPTKEAAKPSSSKPSKPPPPVVKKPLPKPAPKPVRKPARDPNAPAPNDWIESDPNA